MLDVGTVLSEDGSVEPEKCSECGFLWSLPLEDSIRLVEGAAGRYTRLLAKGVDAHAGDSGQWSTTGYVWHVVDIIRFGTERLWTLALDEAAGIPGWDQDDMAALRRYEKLSPIVGLHALRAAVREWVKAARETPLSARIEHPSLGTLSTSDSIRRNAHEVQHHACDIERLLDSSG
jgi:hypothetical protein